MRQKLQSAWITWSMTAIAALSLFAVDSLWRGQSIQPTIGKSLDAVNNRPADSLVHPAPSRAPGLWGVIKSLLADVSDNRLMTEAAGITFYALLALFPALAATVSLYGLYANPATVADHLHALSGVIPGGGMEIINDQIKRVTSNGTSTLGFGLFIGLATSIWSSNQAIKALFDSLNVVFREKEERSFIRRTALTLAFTVGAIIFILIAMAVVVALPIVLNFIGFGSLTDELIRLARWPLMLVGVALFIALVFRFGPCRQSVVWRWVSWGSAVASITWEAGSVAFSWYVANFGSYNTTYGSLGAVIGFMTWIWLSTFVVLLGAQLDSEMETRARWDEKVPVDNHPGQGNAIQSLSA
jgi:membrane protein